MQKEGAIIGVVRLHHPSVRSTGSDSSVSDSDLFFLAILSVFVLKVPS